MKNNENMKHGTLITQIKQISHGYI